MATKSDFAQKLLHDLRLRKEGMAASQSTNHLNLHGRDAYTNPGQTYKGSRQIKALESIGSKTVSRRPMSSGGSTSVGIKELSQQIVSYGRNGSSEYIGDLSMAFAYALQNGGKLSKMDLSSGRNTTMIDFLHQIGRRSLDMGKMGREGSFVKHHSSTSSFPTLSHIHIQEISKGVQNLNQILKSCSNGINFDKYSIEVGKELLKGAMCLEESLRMIVNMQEASEYMITPQRKNKNRITLLEEEEDDNDNNSVIMAEQKQLINLPRFSFDKPSKNSHGTKQPARQKLMALTYTTDPPSSTLSDTKSSSSSLQSKSEKGRISNVIAKLMGLEELPPGKVESQCPRTESSSKKKEGMVMKTSYTNTKNVEVSTRAAENKKQTNKTPLTKDAVVSNGKQHRKDFNTPNTTNGVPGPNRTAITVGKQQSNTNQSNYILENRKHGQEKERGQYSSKYKEQKSTEKSDTKELVLKDEPGQQKVPQKQRSPEVAGALQEKIEGKKSKVQEQGAEKSNQKISKQESQTRKHVASQMKPKVSSKAMHGTQKKLAYENQGTPSKRSAVTVDMMPLKEPLIQHNEELFRAESSTENVGCGKLNKSVSLRESETKTGNVPILQKKVDSKAVHRCEAPRKMDEVFTRRNGPLNNLARPLKHKLSIMQELKQGRQEKRSSSKGVNELSSISSKGVEPGIEKSKNSESSVQSTNGEKHIQDEDECQSPKDNSQNITSKVCKISSDQKGQAPDCREDIEMKFQEASQNLPVGANEGSRESCYILHQENKKSFTSGTQVVLTETEKHLKEVLVKDNLFLNTAEALFKLNIPVGILDADDHNHHGEETKVKLDCSYEIMRRKARNQELAVHPYVKISVSYTMIRHLDDLVKQLYKDLESLRFYGRNAHDEFDASDYLHKMLERDIQNKDPDINSFWDFGWNETTFSSVEKYDFVRDVEQYVLHCLIHEIAEDLLNTAISFD